MSRLARLHSQAGLTSFLEANWLLLLVMTPLFFDVVTPNVFEFNKAMMLRLIVLLMVSGLVVAWVHDLAWGPGSDGPQPEHELQQGLEREYHSPRRWLFILVAGLAICTLAATVFSLDRLESLWGSLDRGQGWLTQTSYLVLFAIMATFIRDSRQIIRIMLAIAVTGALVSLYGVLQHFAVDPLPWSAEQTVRIGSTLGNPIFASAYLILSIPATGFLLISRLLDAERGRLSWKNVLACGILVIVCLVSWMHAPRTGTVVTLCVLAGGPRFSDWFGLSRRRMLGVAALAVIMSLQVAAILFANSRGPSIGLVAGTVGVGVLILSRAVAHNSKRRLGIVLIALVVGIMALTQLNPVRSFLERTEVGQRISMTSLNEGTVRVRTLTWKSALDSWVQTPERWMTGFGPGTLAWVVRDNYPPELGRIEDRRAFPDRAHNLLVHRLVTEGVLSALVFLLLQVSLILAAGAAAGNRSSSPLYVTALRILAISLVAGLGVSWMDGSPRFFPLVASLTAMASIWIQWYFARQESSTMAHAGWVGMAAAVALLAWMMEGQSGLDTTSTSMMSMVWGALALSALRIRNWQDLPEGPRLKRETHRKDSRSPSRDRSHCLIAVGIMMGWAVLFLISNTVHLGPGKSIPDGMLWLLILSLLLAVAVSVSLDGDDVISRRDWILTASGFAFPAGLWLLIRSPDWQPAGIPDAAFLWLLAMTIASTLALSFLLSGPRGRPSRSWWIRSGAILCLALAPAFLLSINPLRSELWRRASAVMGTGGMANEQVLSRYQHAVQLQPNRAYPWVDMARMHADDAAERQGSDRDNAFNAARAALMNAKTLQPHNHDHPLNLMRLYRTRVPFATSTSEADSLELIAASWARESMPMIKRIPAFLNETSMALGRADLVEEAVAGFRMSLDLDSLYTETYRYFGAMYVAHGMLDQAESVYEEGLRSLPDSPELEAARAYIQSMRHSADSDKDTPSEGVRE